MCHSKPYNYNLGSILLKRKCSIKGVDRTKGEVINEWGIMCDIINEWGIMWDIFLSHVSLYNGKFFQCHYPIRPCHYPRTSIVV